ncbi:MAG: DUF2339 domain-containing protein [Candidatus Zixiibacteriota bacterium]
MEALLVVVAIWVVGAPIFLLVKQSLLKDRMSLLEMYLEATQRRLTALEAAKTTTSEQAPLDNMSQVPTSPVSQPAPTPPSPSTAIATPPAAEPTTAQQPSYMAPPPIAETPRPTYSARPQEPSRTKQEWEALIGGKLLNRIGAVALIFGVGFFLKYAFDNNWISETVRVIIGIIAGAGLLFVGNHFHKKNFAIFAQGVIGAGVAILYLSVYAAFNYYHLVGQITAVFMMGAVTAVTFYHAVRHDALPIALLGWAGGFLTPILLSTDEVNEIRLFSYLAALDLGLLAMAIRKPAWKILEPLSLVATYVFYFMWYDEAVRPIDTGITALFLTIFWALFLAAEFWHNWKGSVKNAIHEPMSIANITLYSITLNVLLHPNYPDWGVFATLAMGVIYFGGYLFYSRRDAESKSHLEQYLPMAIGLLAVATWLEFDKYRLAMVWSAEALALMWAGVYWNKKAVWSTVLGLFAVTLCSLFFHEETFRFMPLADYRFIFNERTFALVALAAAVAGSALLSRKLKSEKGQLVRDALNLGWFAILFVAATVEALDYFRYKLMIAGWQESTRADELYRHMTLVIIWSVYSLGAFWIGLRNKLELLAGISLAVTLFVILFAMGNGYGYFPAEEFTLFLNIRALALIVAMIVLYAETRLLAGSQMTLEWLRVATTTLRVVIGITVLYFLTVETWALFERSLAPMRGVQNWTSVMEAERAQLANLQQLSLSGVWLVYSVVLMVFGIWKRRRPLRVMSIALFGVTILKIFIYDLSFLTTLYRIFSFIGLGLILLAVSYAYQRFKGVIFDEAPKGPTPGNTPQG